MSEDLQELYETIDNEAKAMLGKAYTEPALQLSLFEDFVDQKLKPKKLQNGLTWQQEIMAQYLARGYTKIDAYTLSHPNSKTENLNTLYPKASKAANVDKVRTRVDQIKEELERKALMSTTEFYARLTAHARSMDKGALDALKMIGQIKGVFNADKDSRGTAGEPLTIRVIDPAEWEKVKNEK